VKLSIAHIAWPAEQEFSGLEIAPIANQHHVLKDIRSVVLEKGEK
jgi:hypothetical protein